MPVELGGAVLDDSVALEFTDARRYRDGAGVALGYNGFAACELQGAELALSYRDLTGRVVYREEFRAAGADVTRVAAGAVGDG